MTVAAAAREPWRSRWLPAVVFGLFAAVLLADVVVVVIYGNYRNLVEEPGIEAVFTPEGSEVARPVDEPGEPTGGDPTGTASATTAVAVTGNGFRILEPGTLTVRFRSPDAGAYLELDYRFDARRPGSDVELVLGRVASRYGVDTMCRRSIDADKRKHGVFRHYLADHAGWFELRIAVDAAAVDNRFEVGLPRIVGG